MAIDRDIAVLKCSTPEGIESGEKTARMGVVPVNFSVLNARRHRSGEKAEPGLDAVTDSVCSTPEGIGAGRSAVFFFDSHDRMCAQRPKASERGEASPTRSPPRIMCSTPEGIGAGRRSRRTAAPGLVQMCSTPEGIGAGEVEPAPRLDRQRQVLNARRHRSGRSRDVPGVRGGSKEHRASPAPMPSALSTRSPSPRRDRLRLLPLRCLRASSTEKLTGTIPSLAVFSPLRCLRASALEAAMSPCQWPSESDPPWPQKFTHPRGRAGGSALTA